MQPANLVVMPIIPPNGLAVGRTWMCVSPTSSTHASWSFGSRAPSAWR